MEPPRSKTKKSKNRDAHRSMPISSSPPLYAESESRLISASASTLPSLAFIVTTPEKETLVKDYLPQTKTSPTGTSSSTSSGSKESLRYLPYGDGLLNETAQSVERVNFCFRCEKKVKQFVPIIMGSSRRNEEKNNLEVIEERQPRRSRSASSAYLQESTEKTGLMLDGNFVHRKVFLCPHCREWLKEQKKEKPDFILRISNKALAYYK